MRIGRKKTLIDRAHEYVDSVAENVKPHLEAALDSASVAARDAADKAGPRLTEARDRAVPLIQDARDRAVPLAQDARDRAVPLVQDARARATEAAALGAGLAAEKASAGRDLAAARLAQVKAEPEPRKGGKLKKLLLLGGLAAVGGVVYSKLREQSSATGNWQSSYVPTPAPAASAGTPTEAPGAAMGSRTSEGASPADGLADPLNDPLPGDASVEDPAGAAPGEAASDSHEAPHAVTTPDDPAEVVDVEGQPRP